MASQGGLLVLADAAAAVAERPAAAAGESSDTSSAPESPATSGSEEVYEPYTIKAVKDALGSGAELFPGMLPDADGNVSVATVRRSRAFRTFTRLSAASHPHRVCLSAQVCEQMCDWLHDNAEVSSQMRLFYGLRQAELTEERANKMQGGGADAAEKAALLSGVERQLGACFLYACSVAHDHRRSAQDHPSTRKRLAELEERGIKAMRAVCEAGAAYGFIGTEETLHVKLAGKINLGGDKTQEYNVTSIDVPSVFSLFSLKDGLIQLAEDKIEGWHKAFGAGCLSVLRADRTAAAAQPADRTAAAAQPAAAAAAYIHACVGGPGMAFQSAQSCYFSFMQAMARVFMTSSNGPMSTRSSRRARCRARCRACCSRCTRMWVCSCTKTTGWSPSSSSSMRRLPSTRSGRRKTAARVADGVAARGGAAVAGLMYPSVAKALPSQQGS